MTTSHTDLLAYSFLSDLNPAQLTLIAEASAQVEFPAGHFIGRAGEPASHLYLLAHGAARLQAFVSERGPVTIGLVSAGQPLGWSSFVPPFRLHYDAVAVEPVGAVALESSRIRALCAADHDLGFKLYDKLATLIAERLQTTRLQLIGLFIGDVESEGWV